MNKSENINELASALAKAQSQIKNAPFDKVNPHFKNKYSSLASIRDAVTPALSANGIAIIQCVNSDTMMLETVLAHSSGQFISDNVRIVVAGSATPQAFGSALTYARRYGLASIVGISSDDDDDAEIAEEEVKKHPLKAHCEKVNEEAKKEEIYTFDYGTKKVKLNAIEWLGKFEICVKDKLKHNLVELNLPVMNEIGKIEAHQPKLNDIMAIEPSLFIKPVKEL